MRRALAFAALLAFLPTAHAQDKAKGEMSHSGEYRLRDFFSQNPTARKDAQKSRNGLDQRVKLDMGYKASEKLTAHVTLLSNINWGAGGQVGTATNNTTPNDPAVHNDTAGNLLSVNQAYANWMISPEFSMKFGRQNFMIGDGLVMGGNDWLAVPYTYDGLVAGYEMEFGKFQAFGLKLRDRATAAGATNSPTASDPEHNLIGLNFDLKTMPEFLKAVNVHVIKNRTDINPVDANAAINGRDELRYGLSAAAAFSIVDLKLSYAAHSGKTFNTGATPKGDIAGSMMQGEVGVNFASMMGSRLFVQYHMDSGDKDGADSKDQNYDGFFQERHNSTGMMDVFRFGNLTFIKAGATAKPMDNTTVGVQYIMFSRSEKGASNSFDRYALATGGTNVDNASKNLGSEIDLYAEHKYDNGLTMVARVGQFSPGGYFKGTTPSKDSITEVMLEGKFSF